MNSLVPFAPFPLLYIEQRDLKVLAEYLSWKNDDKHYHFMRVFVAMKFFRLHSLLDWITLNLSVKHNNKAKSAQSITL